MSTATYLAAEVRAEMARQRRKGRELATHLQCSPQSVSKRLRGEVPITTDELVSIGSWLGIEPRDLLDRATRAAS